jgi:hypothetical protein
MEGGPVKPDMREDVLYDVFCQIVFFQAFISIGIGPFPVFFIQCIERLLAALRYLMQQQ